MKRSVLFMLLTINVFVGWSQTAMLVERSKAGTVSVIPQEYSYTGLPKIVASDYDEDSRSCEYRVFDSMLESELSGTFSPHTVVAGTHREYGEEITYYCYGGETDYILSDTVMSRMSIDILQPSGETVKKYSGITEAEVETYFIPTAPEVLYETTYWEWEERMYNPGYTIVKSETSVCEYERKTMYGYNGVIFSNFIYTTYGRFFYPYSWSTQSDYKAPYKSYKYDYKSGGETEPFVFYLDEKGEFYKITFRNVVSKSVFGFERGTIYGADFSIVDDDPTYYVSSPLKVSVLNKGLTGGECMVTYSQTLFNDDADLEYVGYKYGNPKSTSIEKDRDNDGYIDYRETTTHYSIVGLLVLNMSNDIIYSIDFPSGYELASGDIKLLDMLENRYLIVPAKDVNSSSNSDRYMLVYRIDPEQASVEQMGEPMRARVFPTIVSRGTDVTVELPTDQGNSDIMVTSMSGQTEMTRRVQSGTNRTVIPTGTLSNGVHVVSVTDRDQNRHDTTRIVVK